MPPVDPVSDGIRCMLMRGGTSKGAYFLADDLPSDAAERDELLLRIMGSPDPRQIDGLGGANPLTSKVAIVSTSMDAAADVDYLFLQIGIDETTVTDRQTCGNLLAGVVPFVIERGLVQIGDPETELRIRLLNTGDIASATMSTPEGQLDYDGDASIDGVPGLARGINLKLTAPTRSLLPTGNVADDLIGHRVTLVDNGMPVVLLEAAGFGLQGFESREALEENTDLGTEIEQIRLVAGELFDLGDVSAQTVPRMLLLSPPRNGGVITTRAFIPKRVHSSIGVLMAASVAAGLKIPGAVGHDMARLPDGGVFDIEHPAGSSQVRVQVEQDDDGRWHASSTSTRTARKIFDGVVFARPRL